MRLLLCFDVCVLLLPVVHLYEAALDYVSFSKQLSVEHAEQATGHHQHEVALRLTIGVETLILRTSPRYHFIVAFIKDFMELRTKDDLDIDDMFFIQ